MNFGPLDWRVAGKPLSLLQDQWCYSLVVLILFESGVVYYFKRKTIDPFIDACFRATYYVYASCGRSGEAHLMKGFYNNEKFNVMKGITVVDTEAVLKIVDLDPEDEAKRVKNLS